MSKSSPEGREKTKRVAVEFEAALKRESEEAIQVIMANNRGTFFPGVFAISKYKLADAFVTDFLTIGPSYFSNTPIPMVSLIEIERADFTLFTVNGDPSAKLTHALRQVQDWKAWVKRNQDYLCRQIQEFLRDVPEYGEEVRGSLQYGFLEQYRVFIGRRNSMSIADRLRLSQMNEDLHEISVMTYDVLLDQIVARVNGEPWFGDHIR